MAELNMLTDSSQMITSRPPSFLVITLRCFFVITYDMMFWAELVTYLFISFVPVFLAVDNQFIQFSEELK